MDDAGYDSDGDLVLSLVPGLAEGLSASAAAAADAEADRNRAAACRPPPSTPFAAAATATQEHSDLDLNFHQQQRQQPTAAPPAAAAPARPLSAYNRSNAAAKVPVTARSAAAPAASAPAPVNFTSCFPSSPSPSSSFPLPSSAKVALEELRVSLDPRIVTHATGHAMLPALAAAGIRARVGGGGGAGEREPARSLRWRAVLFFRRRRKRAAAPRRRAAPRGAAEEDEADVGCEEGEEGDFVEEQVPFVLVCLTAADVIKMVDRARSEGEGEEEGRRPGGFGDFDPGAGLERLVREAAAAHPGRTLGVVVEGLESFCVSRERADAARDSRPSPARRRGGGGAPSSSSHRGQARECFIARRYDPRLLAASAALRFPALRLTLLPDAAAVAEHLIGLARALAEQPLRAIQAAVSCGAQSSPSSAQSSQQQLLRTHGGGRRGDTQAAREALLLVEATTSAADGGQQLPAASVALARALARIPGVGPAAAVAVAAEHGSFGGLMRFVEEGGGAAGGGREASASAAAAAIAELRTKTRNAADGASGPRVGPAAARRVVAMLQVVDGGVAADW